MFAPLPAVREDFYEHYAAKTPLQRGMAYFAVEPPSEWNEKYKPQFYKHTVLHWTPRLASSTFTQLGGLLTNIGITSKFATKAFSEMYKMTHITDIYSEEIIQKFGEHNIKPIDPEKGASNIKPLRERSIKVLKKRHQIRFAINIILTLGSVLLFPVFGIGYFSYRIIDHSIDVYQAVKASDKLKAAESIARIAADIIGLVGAIIPDPTLAIVKLSVAVLEASYYAGKTAYKHRKKSPIFRAAPITPVIANLIELGIKIHQTAERASTK